MFHSITDTREILVRRSYECESAFFQNIKLRKTSMTYLLNRLAKRSNRPKAMEGEKGSLGPKMAQYVEVTIIKINNKFLN